MDRILIIGVSGMLGHTLFRRFRNDGLDVFGTVRNRETVARSFSEDLNLRLIDGVDVEKLGAVRDVCESVRPTVVINCAGVIKQLPEANDPLHTLPVNSLFPHQLARLCREMGARLIHISTDCIFDGTKGNYTESDPVSATDLYGLSKYLGEISGDNCLTIRTSIIGHELATRYGLLEWFLTQKVQAKGFTRAIFSGFPTTELYRIIRDYVIPNRSLEGVYQVSSDPVSKYDLLRLVAKVYGKETELLPDDSFVCDRSLNSARFRTATGYEPPSWPELVRAMHEDYLQSTCYTHERD